MRTPEVKSMREQGRWGPRMSVGSRTSATVPVHQLPLKMRTRITRKEDSEVRIFQHHAPRTLTGQNVLKSHRILAVLGLLYKDRRPPRSYTEVSKSQCGPEYRP